MCRNISVIILSHVKRVNFSLNLDAGLQGYSYGVTASVLKFSMKLPCFVVTYSCLGGKLDLS